MGLLLVLAAFGLGGSAAALAQATDKAWRELQWTSLPTKRPFPRAFVLPFDFDEFYSQAPVTDRRDAATVNTMRDKAAGQGPELSLKLNGSKTITFVDCGAQQPGCPLGMFHLLVAWWPNYEAYVVLVGGASWGSAYIVSAKDGNMILTSGNPVLSPSGRYAVAQAMNGDPPDPMSLEVIDLSSAPPKSIDSGFKAACPGHQLREKAVWLDDTSVTFEDIDSSARPNPGKDESRPILRITNGKLDWRC